MIDILAIRDNETGQVPECRQLAETEAEDIGTLYAAKRKQYPPPRYELVIGVAESLDGFLTNYPRFKSAQGRSGDGTERDRPPRERSHPRPDSPGPVGRRPQ